jgi:hypothetical protein
VSRDKPLEDRAFAQTISDIPGDLRYIGDGASQKDVEDELVTTKGGMIGVGIGFAWRSARMSIINPNKEA